MQEESMKVRSKTAWVLLLSFVLIFSAFCMMARDGEAKQGFVGTETCIACHHTWLDNNPPVEDTASGNLDLSYPPLNLSSSRTGFPFYTIPEGYVKSIHYITAFDLTGRDHVKCEDCHGSGIVHYGVGAIPVPIPNTKTCGGCHEPPFFEFSEFLKTSHANPNRKPGKFYDQGHRGTSQAKVTLPGGEKAFLVKAGTFGPEGDPVTKNERIQECSVCHSYALNYPQFQKKIAHGKMPNPEVSCGACHDSHIVAPSGPEPAIVTSTVKVTALSGSPTPNTVTSVEPAPGREVHYINNKPYKVNAGGAQDAANGIWARGSSFNVPNITLVRGVGFLSTEHGVSDLLTLNCDLCTDGGGLLKNEVKPHDTVFIWGEASATVNLPADAKDAGKPVTVRANFEMAGFVVEEVIDDKTLLIESRDDSAAGTQLGNDKIAVVTKVNVTYEKAAGGRPGTLAVAIPLSGLVQFEIRDMYTNTETLCGSCHTQGTYKYTRWGTIKNGELGAIVDLSATHNKNVYGQYLLSGHADRQALAFKEFNASDYGSSHQQTYPFDMSITGSGGIDSLRNKGNMQWKLASSPNLANAYFVAPNNSDLYGTSTTTLINNYACLQCHHGLASIDFQLDRQGTTDASVLWGDANVTCLTCHDPHKDATRSEKNIRVPVKLSYNSRFVDATKNPKGGINKFMDGTDIPAGAGDGIICLFCHQGRESGLTVYLNVSGRNVNPYTEPDKVIVPTVSGLSFQNPHYLESGAILWSKNTWEYIFDGIPQTYSNGNPLHQEINCTGCHMAEASPDNLEGGHSWRPRIETCQQCHGNVAGFQAIPASFDYDGDGIPESSFAEIGTINPDSGLFGQVKAALAAKGIFYNPDTYPYYFNAAGGSFTAFTTNTLTAAFNLSFLYKAGNCAYVHNARYAAQILQDSLRALGVTPTGVRPPGDRDATDYRTIVVNP